MNVRNRRIVSAECDALRRPTDVELADMAYRFAQQEVDSTPHPTLAQRKKLDEARVRLRLACSVHGIDTNNGGA